MLHIKETIVVEGRYDKEKLKRVTDAPIICTGGFDLYKNKNTVKAICSMAEKTGVIILTDSDRAGFRIRSYIKQCTGGRGSVKHAYIPTVLGKERRKDKAGKEGILGVEGIDEETLAEILSRVAEVTDSAFGTGNAEGFIGADCADKANTDKCAQCADNSSTADCRGASSTSITGNSNSAASAGGASRGTVTSAMFYEDGFTGKDGSAELRARLAKQLGLPLRITPKAMLDIINKAYGVDEYKKAAEKVRRGMV